MKVVAIVQARTGSTRLPGKVFLLLEKKPLIWHIFNRLSYCTKVDDCILATTENETDNELCKWAFENKIEFYRGSTDDVLSRFYFAALKIQADLIVRITADDPFKDPVIIDSVIAMVERDELDFGFNNKPPSFPEGLDVEVFTFKSLEKAQNLSKDSFEREHVTQFFYRNPGLFKMKNWGYNIDVSYLRWTIDTNLDFKMAKKIYALLYKEGKMFYFNDILDILEKYPEISTINDSVKRSEMYKK